MECGPWVLRKGTCRERLPNARLPFELSSDLAELVVSGCSGKSNYHHHFGSILSQRSQANQNSQANHLSAFSGKSAQRNISVKLVLRLASQGNSYSDTFPRLVSDCLREIQLSLLGNPLCVNVWFSGWCPCSQNASCRSQTRKLAQGRMYVERKDRINNLKS